jgi:hypothetical protein
MKTYKGKAINEPLKEGTEWEKFRVVTTPEFEAMRVKAIELLLPYANEELENVSSSLTYFKIDEDDSSEHDVCDYEDCIEKMQAHLKEKYPDSEIETEYSADDSDHEHLNTCAICGRHLNTQLTWVEYEVEYYIENKEDWNKESFISSAFDLYCILEALPSNDYDATKYVIKEYDNGNTLHIDLRTKFYEKIMELIDSIIIHLDSQPHGLSSVCP